MGSVMGFADRALPQPTYGRQAFTPWDQHLILGQRCDNENRYFPDPLIGPPPTPAPGMCQVTGEKRLSRMMSRANHPYEAIIPYQQQQNSLPGRPPYGTCPTNRSLSSDAPSESDCGTQRSHKVSDFSGCS